MPASGGRTVSLASMKGKPFVLYFYPKADTPGCTKEACAFQEALPQLGKIGIDVIGVSKDKMKPIEKFAEKYRLTFPLASDERPASSRPMAPGWRNPCMARNTWEWTEHRPRRQGGQDGEDLAQGEGAGHAAEVMQAAKAL